MDVHSMPDKKSEKEKKMVRIIGNRFSRNNWVMISVSQYYGLNTNYKKATFL